MFSSEQAFSFFAMWIGQEFSESSSSGSFSLNNSFLNSSFSLSSQEEPSHFFNAFLEILSGKYPVPLLTNSTFQNTVQPSFCYFIMTSISPLSSNTFLTSVWDLTKMAFTIYFLFVIICVFCKKIEAFTAAFLFSESSPELPLMVFSCQSWLLLACTSWPFQPLPITQF